MSSYDYTPNGRRRPTSSRDGTSSARPRPKSQSRSQSQERRSARARTRSNERDDAASIRRTGVGRRSTPSRDERERSVRAASRQQPKESRSVGAHVMSYPLSIGSLDGQRRKKRAYGRGTTARRVQTQREEGGIPIRPAIYTQDKVGIRDRMHIARRWGLAPSIAVWKIVLAVVVVLLLAAVAIAGPLRDYYHAWRDEGVLKVEYEVLSTINEGLSTDVERLNTLEGIEDEARRRGYVYPDEEALVVEGLDETTPTEQEQIDRAIAEYEEGLPWYVPVLDDLLGYSRR